MLDTSSMSVSLSLSLSLSSVAHSTPPHVGLATRQLSDHREWLVLGVKLVIVKEPSEKNRQIQWNNMWHSCIWRHLWATHRLRAVNLSSTFRSRTSTASVFWSVALGALLGVFRDPELRKDGQPLTKLGLMSPGACHTFPSF